MRARLLLTLLASSLLALPVSAQDAQLEAGLRVDRLIAEPAELTFVAGTTTPVRLTALDAAGNPVDAQIRIVGRGVEYADGSVTADEGGEGMLIASVVLPPTADMEPASVVVPVRVTWPRVARIDVSRVDGATLYEGTTVRFSASSFFANGGAHSEASYDWSTSDPAVATVDGRGNVTAHASGSVSVYADFDGARGALALDVAELPVTGVRIRGGAETARQGDVVTFDAVVEGSTGALEDVPVAWSVSYQPDDSIKAPGATGIVEDGKFVGEQPGLYTVFARVGDHIAARTVDVAPRQVVREVELQGQGSVSHVHSADLWVYEGADGRDYAVTGTWGGDGWAYFWDVTDPTNVVKSDSLRVDARTVNDVKVSPDGRYAALSREGASNRRNGVVILDLSDPAHPTVASTYDEGLTGGVHNMFATEDHLFALSGGDKYVILDVTDLARPRYVSEYNHPNSRIHDVWVHDGVAYSAEWENGVVVVDVGNGRWGGSIDNPVFVTNVPYPVGRTHAAYPYFQESTGKFYLFLGDEIMNRQGAAWGGAGLGRIPQQGGTPSVTSGYVHIIDFTDPANPADIARYEVPEFGTHNLWVEDDVLYVGYYEGGVRVVDVSGELLGNLATQGREIAVYKAFDPDGYTANAPMAWGAQPHKGNLFFSDFNSGLWSIRVQPPTRPISQ